jgi:hypothetical protein
MVYGQSMCLHQKGALIMPPDYTEVAINKIVAQQVVADGAYGGETSADGHGLFARISNSIIPVSLRTLMTDADPALVLDQATSKMYQRFNLWLIPHVMGVIRRSGNFEPTALGLDVEYKNDGATCSIVSLIPSAAYVKKGSFSGKMGMSGEVTPGPLTDIITGATKEVFGASLEVSAAANATLNVSLEVISPCISAIGQGSDACHWRFDKHEESLLGRDVEMWSVVALPRHQKALMIRQKYYYDARQWFISRRVESDWIELTCKLQE